MRFVVGNSEVQQNPLNEKKLSREQMMVSQRQITWLLLALLPALGGVCFAFFLRAVGIATADSLPAGQLTSLIIFAAQDWLGGLLVALALVAAWFLPLSVNLQSCERKLRLTSATLPAAAFLLSLAIGLVVFHAYPLSLDEFMPEFQAAIFREGFLLAKIDGAQLALHEYLQPFFTFVDEDRGLWASNYRPVHAALLAFLPQIAGFSLLNPVLAAISIWAMADIARRLFPKECLAAPLAALLLLASPQFLINAGSGFSFPAHLAFNLVWLSLFLRGTTIAHIAAALVGALAIGLHQVHVHPLFAAPFLMALPFGVFGPRWRFLIYALVYSMALLFWIAWHEIAIWIQTGDASVLPRSIFEIAYIQDYLRYTDQTGEGEAGLTRLYLVANVLRFLLWLSPAILLLCAIVLTSLRRTHIVVRLAGIGVVLMIAATQVLMPNQMLTWGARYYHPVLGNVVLLAVAGFFAVPQDLRERLTGKVFLLIGVSLVVLLPVRAVQVEAKVGPRAKVQAQLSEIDADLLAFPRMPIWFIPDFVRNDPFLRNRPLMALQIPDVDLGPLAEDVREIAPQDIWDFGLPRGTLYEPGNPE